MPERAPSLPSQLGADDFELFQLPKRFALDVPALTQRWKDLQQLAHPDRHTAQTSQAQRLATQWSVRINEAYQRLKNPTSRAAYLCELAGHAVQAHSNTQMPPDFLIQQMQWRESLEDADDVEAVQALRQALHVASQTETVTCENAIDRDQDWPAAVESVRRMLFMQKFEADIDRRLDQLDD